MGTLKSRIKHCEGPLCGRFSLTGAPKLAGAGVQIGNSVRRVANSFSPPFRFGAAKHFTSGQLPTDFRFGSLKRFATSRHEKGGRSPLAVSLFFRFEIFQRGCARLFAEKRPDLSASIRRISEEFRFRGVELRLAGEEMEVFFSDLDVRRMDALCETIVRVPCAAHMPLENPHLLFSLLHSPEYHGGALCAMRRDVAPPQAFRYSFSSLP